MATWELVIRDGVIQAMLRDLFVLKNLWDEPEGRGVPTWNLTRTTITDVEYARDASILWKCVIDVSPEYSCLRLARWDYAQEMGLAWEPFEEYIPNRMRLNWMVFSESWKMGSPIMSRRLRLNPIGTLSELELSTLRSLLWDRTNTRVDVPPGTFVLHALDLWVSHLHRP